MATLKVILPPAPAKYDRLDQNAFRREVERALSSSSIVADHAPQHYQDADDPVDINQLAEVPLDLVNLEADQTASRLFLVSDTGVLDYLALEVADLPAHAAEHESGGGDEVDHGALIGLADDDHTQYHTDGRADTWFTGKSIADLGTKDHDLLDGLSDDDHTIYLLLAGRSGQTIDDSIEVTGTLEADDRDVLRYALMGA